MKKQFFRVKQLADQKFSRAGKTEVLSDDLQDADRKVEYIKAACQNTGKKLVNCLQTVGQEPEKRLKKVPEYVLGASMLENSTNEEYRESLLGCILKHCGQMEQELAGIFAHYELAVEKDVAAALHQVNEVDVPNIAKHKRNLAKLILDMDSAKTRYQSSVKHPHTGGSNSIKEEMEDAEQKVEQCRDALASEMFQLLSREAQLAQIILDYANTQKNYHEKALEHLATQIPTMEKIIQESPLKPVYRVPLQEHLQVTGRTIAYPIELCVCALLHVGMHEEGLFRVAGSASKLRRMKMSLDAGCLTLERALEYYDPHVIAGAFKSYLRELPTPLMTFLLYDEWIAAAKVPVDLRIQAISQVLQKLPKANFDNLRYIARFLSELTNYSESNKMKAQNIAIVIAPNLMWGPNDDSGTMGMNMNSANLHSIILDSLVSNADIFFPGEIEYYQTLADVHNGMTASGGAELLGGGSPSPMSSYGHTRNSSGDGQFINITESSSMKRTQSSSSLSDHSSPPQGSPKPATRRKNKPAPVPPSTPIAKETRDSAAVQAVSHEKPEKPPRPSAAPVVTTLPRPSKKPMDHHEVRNVPHPNEQSSTYLSEKQHKSELPPIGFENILYSDMTSSSSDIGKNLFVSDGKEQVSDKEFCSGNLETCPVDADETSQISSSSHGFNNTTIANKVFQNNDSYNKKLGSFSDDIPVERKHPQRPPPVAAPRSIVNPSMTNVAVKDNSDIKIGDGNKLETEPTADSVPLRRPPPPEGGKPAIPERPATLLRPHASSFRVSRHSSDSDSASGDKSNSDSERPMLERAHMYSVDKQQVSIIQVGADREKTDSNTHRNSSNGEQPITVSLSDVSKTMEKPERPSRSEIFPQVNEKEKQFTSHSGSLTDGDLQDSGIKHQISPSPRVLHRPPRPHPPPPPMRSRSGSIAESTDL